MIQGVAHQGLLFWREALRVSRQSRTYGLRVGLAVLLFGLLMVIVAVFSQDTRAESTGQLGRAIFYLIHYSVLLTAWVLAPVFCIQGVQEEMDQEVLPLLAMTPLSGRSILWSKVASRIGVLGFVLMTCTPVAAMMLSFGGVAPEEQLWAVYYIVLSCFLLFMASAVLSFASARIVLPLIAVFSYGFWAFVCIPIIVLLPNLSSSRFEIGMDLAFRSMPFVLHPDGPSTLSGIFVLAVLPVSIRLFFVGSALMHQKISSAANPTPYTRWPNAAHWFVLTLASAVVSWIFCLVSTELVAGKVSTGASISAIADWVMVGIVALSFIAFFYFSSMAYLRFIFFALVFLERFSFIDVLRTIRSSDKEKRAPRTFWLLRNPVFWREVFTGGNGASGRVILLLAFFLFVGWLGAGLLMGPRHLFDADVFWVLSIVAYGLTFLSVCVAVTYSVVSERQGETLQCLQVSTFPKSWIVSGKIRAAMFRTAPLWVLLGVIWYLLSFLERAWGDTTSFHVTDPALFFVPAGGVLSFLFVLWSIQVFAAHVCVYSSLWWRNPKTSWMVNMVFSIGFWPALLLCYILFQAVESLAIPIVLIEVSKFIASCIFPWSSHIAYVKGEYLYRPLTVLNFIPSEMLVAIVFWFVGAWVVRRGCVRRLQKVS